MVKVDLITGFLGAGKTTFIQKYIEYLKAQGQKVHVIENEFGIVSADSDFLAEEDCDISDLTGCCMCCTGKDKFEAMLGESDGQGYDRVLVEPSGVYDVDEFFESMFTSYVRKHCEIGSIMTIVDADLDPDLSEETRYMIFSQILAAGAIILSKSQMTTPERIGETRRYLQEILTSFDPGMVLDKPVITADWDALTDEDFEVLMNCGYRIEEHTRKAFSHEKAYQSMEGASLCRDRAHLEEIIDTLMDPANRDKYGQVFRIKGHIKDTEGNGYAVNISRDCRVIRPVDFRRKLYVLIGEDLKTDSIEALFVPRPKKVRKTS